MDPSPPSQPQSDTSTTPTPQSEQEPTDAPAESSNNETPTEAEQSPQASSEAPTETASEPDATEPLTIPVDDADVLSLLNQAAQQIDGIEPLFHAQEGNEGNYFYGDMGIVATRASLEENVGTYAELLAYVQFIATSPVGELLGPTALDACETLDSMIEQLPDKYGAGIHYLKEARAVFGHYAEREAEEEPAEDDEAE